MKNHEHVRMLLFRILREITRLLSGALTGIYLIVIFSGVNDPTEEPNYEGVLVGVFGFLMLASYILTWFIERIGGVTMLIIALLFAVFMMISAGHNRGIASLMVSAVFWLPGLVFTLLDDEYRGISFRHRHA